MIEPTLTNYFKFLIRKEDLIDTGALLASIQVSVKLNTSTNILAVNVIAKDYIKYLFQKYNLTKQFLDSTVFKNWLSNEVKVFAEAKLQDLLNQGIRNLTPGSVGTMTLRFTYNNQFAVRVNADRLITGI